LTTLKRTPKKNTAPKEAPEALDLALVAQKFEDHRKAKNLAAKCAATADMIRDQITPMIEKFGVPWGEKGQHKAIELGKPIDGCTALVRRANKSTFINVDRAEELAESKGFLEDIQVSAISFGFTGTPAEIRKVKAVLKKMGVLDLEGAQVSEATQFSQERLMAYHQRSKGGPAAKALTEKDLDSLYDEDIRYSFNPE
jgi:hypothetical protein